VLAVVRPQRVGVTTPPHEHSPHTCHLQGILQHAQCRHECVNERVSERDGVWSDAVACSYWATVSTSEGVSERLSLRARVLEPLLREFGDDDDRTTHSPAHSHTHSLTLRTQCEVLRVLLEAPSEVSALRYELTHSHAHSHHYLSEPNTREKSDWSSGARPHHG
jgi:hypothetical protein